MAAELADGNTEVTVLMPHRVYKRFWHRLLHDSTAHEMAQSIGQLAHANVTQVPYHLGTPPLTVEHVRAQADGEPRATR